MKTKNEKTKQAKVELYEAPTIEVAEIVIEQNILQSASGEGPQWHDGEEINPWY
jgi:hypothetical protein